MANHVANVILGAIWLTLFGTLFAPIAGIVCSLIARAKRHQRPGRSYWTTGAWYSMLFFAPWLYLVIRMLGLRVPNILVRIWYGIFFACWLIGVLSLFAGSVQQIIVEGRAADGVLLALAAVFLLAVEFVAIRRLMRRQVAYTEERSPAMHRTYALLQALWLAGSVCFVFVGFRELQEYDKLDSAIPLWVLAGFLVAAWLAVRSSIKSSYVDSLDSLVAHSPTPFRLIART